MWRLPTRFRKQRSQRLQKFVQAGWSFCWGVSVSSVLHTCTHNYVFRPERQRERVLNKQRRGRLQTLMYQHGRWPNLRQLSGWLYEQWTHRLHRFVSVAIAVIPTSLSSKKYVYSKYIRPTTCSDVNECASNNGGCHSARTCTNTPGSRICGDCRAGWTNNGPTGCTRLCRPFERFL